MSVVEDNKIFPFNKYFNGNAIKEVKLVKGKVNIKYKNLNGKLRNADFNRIYHVDVFLSQVLQGYEEGKFDKIILYRFVSEVERLIKAQIITNNDIETNVHDIATARKFIDLSVEAIFKIYNAASSKINFECSNSSFQKIKKIKSDVSDFTCLGGYKSTALKLRIKAIEFNHFQNVQTTTIIYSDLQDRFLFRNDAKQLLFNEFKMMGFTSKEQVMIAYFAGMGNV